MNSPLLLPSAKNYGNIKLLISILQHLFSLETAVKATFYVIRKSEGNPEVLRMNFNAGNLATSRISIN